MRAATYVHLGVNPFPLISELSYQPFLGSNGLVLLFEFAFQGGSKIWLPEQEALSALQTRLVIQVTGYVWGVKGSSTLQS